MAAVAENLGRKWICSDLGKFAIHTTRKRMIGVQRRLKAEGKDYRAFEILNLGKYERQHYIGINPNLREAEQQKQLQEKEAAFLDLILRAYRAEKDDALRRFSWKKSRPVGGGGAGELARHQVVRGRNHPRVPQESHHQGGHPRIRVRNGVCFPTCWTKPVPGASTSRPNTFPPRYSINGRWSATRWCSMTWRSSKSSPISRRDNKGKSPTVAVELTDFSVFYSQDSIAAAETALSANRKAGSKIVVEKGQIVKVRINANGIVHREMLTRHWTDWIDYWSVDFDFESKREIIRVQDPETGQWEEQWTGDYVFENEWQSFRTKKDRTLELTSIAHECPPGRRKLAIKVVDIFGNDTMTIVEVTV